MSKRVEIEKLSDEELIDLVLKATDRILFRLHEEELKLNALKKKGEKKSEKIKS